MVNVVDISVGHTWQSRILWCHGTCGLSSSSRVDEKPSYRLIFEDRVNEPVAVLVLGQARN